MKYTIFYSATLVGSTGEIFASDNNLLKTDNIPVEMIERMIVKRMFGEKSPDIPQIMASIEKKQLFLVFNVFNFWINGG